MESSGARIINVPGERNPFMNAQSVITLTIENDGGTTHMTSAREAKADMASWYARVKNRTDYFCERQGSQRFPVWWQRNICTAERELTSKR